MIVANHDLVLASLGMKALPDLDNCLVVFDEGHHLPAVALDQFSGSMDLKRPALARQAAPHPDRGADSDGLALAQDVATVSQPAENRARPIRREWPWTWCGTGSPDAARTWPTRFTDGVPARVPAGTDDTNPRASQGLVRRAGSPGYRAEITCRGRPATGHANAPSSTPNWARWRRGWAAW